MTPSVYINIEESSRELESKLLVAACLAERGMNVVIGQQWLINSNHAHLPPGLVLVKGNNAIQANTMTQAKNFGHLVASIEEENFASSDEKELLRNYDRKSFDICDLFLVPSTHQHDLIVNHCPSVASRVKITGNPRIDLFRPQFLSEIRKESEKIRQKYGRHVLCNFNYCGVNSLIGDTLKFYNLCVRANLYRRNDPSDDQAFCDMLQWERDNLAAMMRTIRELKNCIPDINILVRPHPAERLETWQDVFSGDARITLVAGGSHLPWTLASDIMIHTSCTTGTEAALAGHRAASICASNIPISDGYLSNVVNWRFDSPRDACSFVKGIVEGTTQPIEDSDRVNAILDRHFAARDGELSAERVATALMALLPPPSESFARNWAVKHGFLTKFVTDISMAARMNRKMSAGIDDIKSTIGRFQRALSRFSGVSVIEIGASLFRIVA